MARFADDQAKPNFQRNSAPAAPASSGPVRKNKFGGKCAVCGVYVVEGQGTIVKNESTGRWDVTHIQPCPAAGEPAAKTPQAPATEAVAFSVPDGRYTIIWEDGYKTIRVSHQGEFDEFMPGRAILSFLSGSNNDRDYTSFAHVDERGQVRVWKRHQGNERLREAVKVLLGDPKAASQAYARESGCCGICNRSLTTPESIAAGIGPECAKKVAW